MIKKTKYISASQISIFLKCPLAYKIIYVDGAARVPPNEYMIYGSAVHEALALSYRQKIKSFKDLPAKEVIAFFTAYYKKEVQAASRFGWETDNNLLMKGEATLTAYMKEVAPTIQPKFVEQKFMIPLKSVPVTICGVFDVVDVNDLIIDHKTVGKQSAKDWRDRQDDALDSVQLTIYAAAFRKLFNRPEAGVCLDYLVRSHEPEYVRMQTTRSDEQIKSVIQLAARIEEAVKKDFWYANLNSCKKCDFRNSCKRLSY